MADGGKVIYKISGDNSEFSSDVEKTKKIASKAGGVIKGVFAAAGMLGAAAIGGISAITKKSLEMYSSFQQLAGGVSTLFGANEMTLQQFADAHNKAIEGVIENYYQLRNAERMVMDNASKAWATAGMSANDYMDTATSIAASVKQSFKGVADAETQAAKTVDRAIIDMSDNANKMGTSLDSIRNAYQGFAKNNYTMLDNLKLGYGGTREEMKRLIDDANKINKELGINTQYQIDNMADMIDAIHTVQTSLGITGTTAKEALLTVEGSVNSLKAAWANWLTGLGDADADMSKLSEELVGAVGTVLQNVFPVIQNIFTQLPKLFEELLPLLEEQLPDFLKVGAELLTMLVEGAVSAVSSSSELLAGLIAQIGQVLIDNAPELITAAVEIISTLIGMMAENADLLADGAVQIIMALVTALTDNLDVLLDAAVAIATALVEALVENAPKMLEAALMLVGELILGIFMALGELGNNIGEAFAPVIEGIKATVGDWISSGIEMATNLKNGIVQGFSNMVMIVANKAKEILAKIQEGFKEAVNVGRAVVDGIKNGIAAGWSALTSFVAEKARSLLKAAKAALGIKSPSKAFKEEFGEQIPAGASEGITEATPKAEHAVKQMAEDLLGASYSVEKNLSYTADVSGETVISVPVEIDGEEVARKTAVYTGRQLAWLM